MQGWRDFLTNLGTELVGIVVAALGGSAVGVERQRAYRENEPGAIGGVRTFTLLGTVAGCCGFLLARQLVWPATVILSGAVGMILVVRFRAGSVGRDATTEMAALTVLVTGLTAGLGHLAIAAAIYAGTMLLLIEKASLHALVERIGKVELQAAAQFAALALIVLPVLPAHNFGPGGVLNLRSIWMLVLLFSGISFGGHLTRKALGAGTGWVVTGMIGGLISSTQVAFSFARDSRSRPQSHLALFGGTMAATSVSMLRVCAVCLLLRPAVAGAVLMQVALPVLAGLAFAFYSQRHAQEEAASVQEKNPLNLFAAGYLSLIMVGAQSLASAGRAWFGNAGLMGSAALLGSFDIDALVASVAPLIGQGMATGEAARALTLGILGNTAVKCAATILWGSGRFRRNSILGFVCILAALGFSIFFLQTWG